MDYAKLKKDTFEKVREHLKDDADKPGAVLYNGWSTLCKGDLYIMGFNPGGDEKEPTVIQTLNDRPDDYCDYNDGDWGNGKGNAPHQQRVKRLLEKLRNEDKEAICSVFAANAIFIRSTKASDLPDPQDLWKKHWPIHQYFLAIVRPKVIICLGNGDRLSSFSLLRAVNEISRKYSFCDEQSKSFRGGKYFAARFLLADNESHECTVVGIPHPSRFDFPKNLVEFLKKKLSA